MGYCILDNFQGFYILWRVCLKEFLRLIFADYQGEYISHCFFQGLKFCTQQAYSEIHEIYIP